MHIIIRIVDNRLEMIVINGEKAKIKSSFRQFLVAMSIIATLIYALNCSFNAFSGGVFMRMCASGICTLGVDILVSSAGLVSMGSGAFFGIGAYCGAIITTNLANNEQFLVVLGAVIAFAFAIITNIAVSFLFGLPVLKLRGDYLALCTLGFGEIAKIMFENLEITQGAKGIFGVPKYSSPILCFAVLVAVAVLISKYKKTVMGLQTMAVRDDEIAATNIGINPRTIKLFAFCLCSVICGIGGFFYAGAVGFICPQDFTFSKSIEILTAAVVGGGKGVIGICVAAGVIEYFDVSFQGFAAYKMIIFGIILIAVAMVKHARSE